MSGDISAVSESSLRYLGLIFLLATNFTYTVPDHSGFVEGGTPASTRGTSGL